jgi:hypothetical protein
MVLRLCAASTGCKDLELSDLATPNPSLVPADPNADPCIPNDTDELSETLSLCTKPTDMTFLDEEDLPPFCPDVCDEASELRMPTPLLPATPNFELLGSGPMSDSI